MANWTGNPSMPLLGAGVRSDGLAESAIEIVEHPPPALARPLAPSDAPLHFRRRLRRLLAELRPYEALALAALSIIESIIVAQVGKVAGSFYKIAVDKNPAALLSSLLHAASLYAGCVATAAVGVWLSGRLAVRWRHHLSSLLHRGYCSKMAFLNLPGHLDNPDQRMSAEVATLCDSLAAAVRLAAGAPFRVIYYSAVAWQYLGWRGIAAAVAFFWVAALLQRLAAAPLARCVVAQERREGDLRFSHLRLRDRRAEIAAYRGAAAEKEFLDDGLAAAVSNQRRLVAWRTAVTATTRTTDYSGALLNYGLVGAAVFSGAAGAASGGELAQFVSNASFASLSLIYSFTEVLDLAEQLSGLAALTARVVGLLEALPLPLPGRRQGNNDDSSDSLEDPDGSEILTRRTSGEVALARRRAAAAAAATSLPPSERELQPSGLATTLQSPIETSYLDSTVPMEVSIHSLGPDLQTEARLIFPDAPPPATAHLLCLLTFQFAGGGAVDLSPDRSSVALAAAAAEQDRLLDCFLRWEAALRAALGRQGAVKGARYWCDAVDPRTGAALHGSRGERWSEVAAARALLRYAKRDAGVCPLVVHPRQGTSAYPASFFTDAPADAVAAALAEIAGSDAASLAVAAASPSAFSHRSAPGTALVTIEGLSYATPGGRKSLVEGLCILLTPGEGLLVSGPNGAGKSTLLRVLAGLHAPTAGAVRFGAGLPPIEPFEDPGAAMLLPQRPLAAPGRALWQQLAYPGTARPLDGRMRSLLQEVGLSHLLERSEAAEIDSGSGGSGLDAEESDWGAALSPGEMQRLAIARVLLRRPALVLLDEPCSAMGDAAAAGLLRLLRSAGITCITVAQDTSAYLQAHALHLRLGGSDAEGRWQLGPSGASGGATNVE